MYFFYRNTFHVHFHTKEKKKQTPASIHLFFLEEKQLLLINSFKTLIKIQSEKVYLLCRILFKNMLSLYGKHSFLSSCFKSAYLLSQTMFLTFFRVTIFIQKFLSESFIYEKKIIIITGRGLSRGKTNISAPVHRRCSCL